MSRTARALRGISLGYIHMAVSMVAGLWLTPFLLRHLGTRDFGVWAAAMPMLVTIGLVDFGVVALLQRDVAFSLGKAGGSFEAADDLPDIVGRTVRLVWLQMPVLVLAAVLVLISMPERWEAFRGPAVIVLAGIVASFPLRTYHAVATGLQDLGFLGLLNIVQWAVGFVLGAALVATGFGLYALAISWTSAQMVVSAAAYVRVRVRYRKALPTRLPPADRSFMRERLAQGFWVVVSQLAVTLLAGADLAVVTMLLGASAVTPYAVTGKIIAIVANIPQYIMASAQPALSELRTNHAERERLAGVCLALTQAVLLISGALAVVIVALNTAFVAWWVGAERNAGLLVTVLLTVNMMLRHWMVSLGYTLFAFGHERRISLTTFADGVVTVAACLLLTHFWGLRGTAASGLVGVVGVSLPLHLSAVRVETGMPILTHLRALAPWGSRTLLLLCSGVMFARRGAVPTFLGLAIGGVLALGAYALVVAPLAFRDPLGPYVRARVGALTRRVGRRPSP